MQVQTNVLLKDYTSLHCGGPAEKLVVCSSKEDILEALKTPHTTLWVLGYGTNCLVSDKGLDGLVILLHGGDVTFDENKVYADAGVWWDNLVNQAIERDLWGTECMSGIPSSVGAAVTGNIAAYGQQTCDRLESIEVLNVETKEISTVSKVDLRFNYRKSSLQTQPNLIVLSAVFKLAHAPTMQLKYSSALAIAEECNLQPDDLIQRQKIIMEARKRAGSLYDPDDTEKEYTAGSFFKNPEVSFEQAKKLAQFDESGKTLERILEQNQLHGGSVTRVSAAHVLLAAGFERGQSWKNVQLHPEHILKLQNTGDATASEIYDVANEITQVVKEKLDIELEPEVKFLGQF